MRTVVRLSMTLVALAAAALSYQSLMQLAELAGYGRLSVLYPLVVDAGAAASCAAWLHTRGRQPLLMTWCLLAVSVVLNGTTHYLESTRTAPSWLLVVAVAAVPPTVLGLCVHLTVGMGRGTQPLRTPDRLSTPISPVTGHETQLPTVGHGPTVDPVSQSGADLRWPVPNADSDQAERGSTNQVGVPSNDGFPDPAKIKANPSSDGLADPVAELLAQGAGRRRIASELRISEHQARQLLAERRNGSVTR